MSDRELLELAAKAAGIEYIPGECEKSKESELRFGFWLKFPDGYEVPEGVRRRWNPLTDDGTALQLAVKLKIQITPETYQDYEVTAYRGGFCEATEKATMGYGIEEATRRAIVRAAAEIGKAMT